MRKRWMVRAAGGAALAALAVGGALAGRAAAQSPQTPWLGVTTQEITDDLRAGLDYRGTGVLVNRVLSDSPADRAGIRKGDVIVSFNSRTIDSPTQLGEIVRAGRVGQSVSISIVRGGSRRSVTARLAEWPADLDETPEMPAPPAAPSAPRAPRAPRAYTFNWDGGDFEIPGDGDLTILRSMGRGRLGVHIQDLNSDLADALGVPGGKGVLVTDVIDDTPAAKVGIKAGDVIVEVAGHSVEDIDDLQRSLEDQKGRVSITLVRRGARRMVAPELEARREVTRLRRGDAPMVLRIPDIRTRVRRELGDNDAERGDLEAQLRELRQELRELRKKLEGMEKN